MTRPTQLFVTVLAALIVADAVGLDNVRAAGLTLLAAGLLFAWWWRRELADALWPEREAWDQRAGWRDRMDALQEVPRG